MSTVRFEFDGENYVVVGASSGLGRAVTLSLARAGASVLAIGRNDERLAALHEQDTEHIVVARADVTTPRSMEAAFDEFVRSNGKFSGGVYSAGVFDLTPIRVFDQESAARSMAINFWAAVEFLQLVIKPKYSAGASSTVFLSSIAALTNERGQFVYSATKSALNSVVRTAAKELAPKGHRVNSVSPGWVVTPMTAEFLSSGGGKSVEARHLLGLGTPDDVAGAVLFLLSDAARWITGSNMVVDGGYTA